MQPQVPFREQDDDALMVATARGETRAFDALVERWAPRVLAFLGRALGRRADAEDLAQETFLRLHGAAARYVPSGRFAPWLFRIAGNLARQEMRRRKLRGWLLGTPEQSDAEILAGLPAPRHFDPEGPLCDEETRLALATAIARLPERQRLAVLLRHFEGLKLRDIAAALGTSEHAAESLLARGTKALQTNLRGRLAKD